MRSIEQTKKRAEKTGDAQASITAVWVWNKKTLLQWRDDVRALDQLAATESEKRTAWRNVAELWQADVDRIQQITRLAVSIGRVQYANRPVDLELFNALSTDAGSRDDIHNQGIKARDVWQVVDAAWKIDNDLTLSFFSSLLGSALARKESHGPKETAWRRAEIELTLKAEQVHRDNVLWYEEATRRFTDATVEGRLIRTTVPTTTRTERPVGQAVITNLMAADGDIHFDCNAPYATSYTYLQQAPGAPAFVVALADATAKSLTLHNQPPGLHRFKAVPRNSTGEGPVSEIVEITLAAQQVA